MGETGRNLRCSFCNKSEHEVSQLIAGPNVHICGSCVATAADIIRHSKRPPTQSAPLLTRLRRALRRLIVWGGGGRQRVAGQAAHP